MTSTTPILPLRYDSPTVTLQVMAREAAVSQWSEKPVVQVLRYSLQIRPLDSEEEPVEIRGDRASFLPLIQAVQTYIQGQLTGELNSTIPAENSVRLEPQGLMRHLLRLEGVRTTTGDSAISLGAVQLADLGEVVEQLETAVRPLPIALSPARPARSWRQWGAVAAGMVAAVGLTTVLWPNYRSQQEVGDIAIEAPTVEQMPAPAEAPAPRSPRRPDAASEPADDAPAETPDEPDRESDAIADGGLLPLEPQDPEPDRVPKQRPTIPAVPPSGGAAEVKPAPSPPETATGVAGAAGSSAQTESSAPANRSAAPGVASAPTSPRVRDRPMPPEDPSTAEEGTSIGEAIPEQPAEMPDSEDHTTAPETFSLPPVRPGPQAAIADGPEPLEPPSRSDLVELVRDRWMPPDGLDQTLVYTLVFDPAGLLIEVIPADEQATAYRESTGIPAPGTEWLPTGESQRIELLLKPNGEVDSRDVPSQPVP